MCTYVRYYNNEHKFHVLRKEDFSDKFVPKSVEAGGMLGTSELFMTFFLNIGDLHIQYIVQSGKNSERNCK